VCERVCVRVCVKVCISLDFCCALWVWCDVCLMCVSRKINTAKLRKINKCQRSTRSLSHLTIITLIWDMLTNLLCPHLHSTVDSPLSNVHGPQSTLDNLLAPGLKMSSFLSSIANRFRLEAKLSMLVLCVVVVGTLLSSFGMSSKVSLCRVLC